MNAEQKPPEQEPSLLDYLKSRLRFWDRGAKIEYNASAPPASMQMDEPSLSSQKEMPERGGNLL